MKLGKFSVSLNVKDIQKSKAFYEKLGFRVVGGEEKANWLIMSNEKATIGLFQGMFERNILTFNPGWDSNAEEMSDFTDVRKLQLNRLNYPFSVCECCFTFKWAIVSLYGLSSLLFAIKKR